jgi:hypothetical protein
MKRFAWDEAISFHQQTVAVQMCEPTTPALCSVDYISRYLRIARFNDMEIHLQHKFINMDCSASV